MSDLQAFKIQHPNWHNLSVWPILAWLPYVDKLLPALRRRNIREARQAIDHVDMPQGLRPTPLTERPRNRAEMRKRMTSRGQF